MGYGAAKSVGQNIRGDLVVNTTLIFADAWGIARSHRWSFPRWGHLHPSAVFVW
ncbi:hypothetical protein D187_010184 [Cystobacter fuscus DSM 2262]|uniref:Uncharacterized protein n=1 Tax=Cystobacter fuscus (strain ATCC 25194 / DSM 2262 / NBRC 100088 / M29) TaxID=1242864 RepID=S9PAZ9_CYSF2|nr:hypothetical protein D187_010184 [Cystobacter fuscus DSM 2262]